MFNKQPVSKAHVFRGKIFNHIVNLSSKYLSALGWETKVDNIPFSESAAAETWNPCQSFRPESPRDGSKHLYNLSLLIGINMQICIYSYARAFHVYGGIL